jgi:GTPase SAR1 family protein
MSLLKEQVDADRLIIGALIVYDITDLESWSKVSKWVKELQMYLPPDTPIIITGNKCDIPNR